MVSSSARATTRRATRRSSHHAAAHSARVRCTLPAHGARKKEEEAEDGALAVSISLEDAAPRRNEQEEIDMLGTPARAGPGWRRHRRQCTAALSSSTAHLACPCAAICAERADYSTHNCACAQVEGRGPGTRPIRVLGLHLWRCGASCALREARKHAALPVQPATSRSPSHNGKSLLAETAMPARTGLNLSGCKNACANPLAALLMKALQVRHLRAPLLHRARVVLIVISRRVLGRARVSAKAICQGMCERRKRHEERA